MDPWIQLDVWPGWNIPNDLLYAVVLWLLWHLTAFFFFLLKGKRSSWNWEASSIDQRADGRDGVKQERLHYKGTGVLGVGRGPQRFWTDQCRPTYPALQWIRQRITCSVPLPKWIHTQEDVPVHQSPLCQMSIEAIWAEKTYYLP